MSNYRIKDIPIMERPRERFVEVGVENLTNSELIAIILKNGLKNRNVNDIAIDILNKYSLNELKDISINNLESINGIGKVKAIELISAIELGKRIFLQKNSYNKLSSPKEIWEDARYLFHSKKQEMFYCYYFNTKNDVLKKKCIFIGTNNRSTTHTREIFMEAYKVGASSIVCLHNHPSGDVTPSKEDINFTNHLIETGKIQGIPIIDHIIVGNDKYYSFYEDNNL